MGKTGKRKTVSLKEFMAEYSKLPYKRVEPIYINGIKTCYEVRDNGCIMSYRKGNGHGYVDEPKSLVGGCDSDGYRTVCLRLDKKQYTYRVHRLVALAFIPNPNNYPEVNHKNGNKMDNRVENLEWCTSEYNVLHAEVNGYRTHKWGLKYRGTPMLGLACKMLEINYYTIPEISILTGIPKKKLELLAEGLTKDETAFAYETTNYKPHESYLDPKHPFRLTDLAVILICKELMKNEFTYGDIALMFNTTKQVVYNIYKQKKYKKISEQFDFPVQVRHKPLFDA